MNKNLTAKIQKIENNATQFSNVLSRCISLEPDTTEIRLKKGFVYIVFNLESNIEFDTEITSKVIADILKDSYFQAESISPTQSLEKAISDVREKIVQTLVDKQTLGKQTIKLEVIGAVLWGNVLYFVQMGEGNGYLFRDNSIRTMNTIAEGNFATASGVAKDGDVLLLATKKFTEQISPNNLLASMPNVESLVPGQACLIAKFIADTTFTEKEFIEFAPDTVVTRSISAKNTLAFEAFFSGIKSKIRALKTKFKRPEKVSEPKENKNFENFKNKVRIIKVGGSPVGTIARKKVFKINWYVAPVLGIALLGAVVVTALRNEKTDTPKEAVKETPIIKEEPKQAEVVPEKPKEEDTTNDLQNKINRVDATAFYDLKMIDSNFSGGELSATNNLLVVSDKASGKIYSSNMNTPQFKAFTQNFAGIKSLHQIDGNITFADDTGYYVIDVANDKKLENITKPGLQIVYPYLGFVYTPTEDKIMKLTKSAGKFTESLWAQSEDFKEAKDLVVAYSIYILKADNTIVTYTSGKKDSFATTGIDKPMSGATQLYTDIDFKNIYVTDKDNRRVVVFDKKGGFVTQYKTKRLDQWNNLKSLYVTPDEKTIYVLDDAIIYSFGI
jgi:hypothetical protein